jgi:alkanesulfonate monooxygenase SsuD/methylene tetrahydromethanopterin reductase-like flavin-dependent oxidoreductase (luciferase family)
MVKLEICPLGTPFVGVYIPSKCGWGGDGEQRTLRAVARHADWWNCYSQPPDVARRKLDVLNQHCEAEGRDFASIRKTWSGSVIIDRDHQPH